MGKYVMKQSKTGPYFVLKAANGEPIGTSEVYSSEAAAKNGIESVKKNAPIAQIEDQTVEGWKNMTNPVFELYKDKAGEFRFRLKATNGQIIATGEGYKAMAGCKRGIESIKKNVVDAKIIVEAPKEAKAEQCQSKGPLRYKHAVVLFFVTQQIILVCCVFFFKALSGRSYFPRSSNTTISGATSVRTGGPQKP